MKRTVPTLVIGVLIGTLCVLFASGKKAPEPVVASSEPVTFGPETMILAPKQLPTYGPPPAALTSREAVPEVKRTEAARPLVAAVVAARPLSVTIFGPTKQTVSDGPLRFSAVLTGEPVSIKWRVKRIDVVPSIDSRGLTVTDNGRDVSFGGPAGDYVLGVAVTDGKSDVDWWWHDFTITKDIEEPTPHTPDSTATMNPPQGPPPAAMPPQAPQEDLASYVGRLVNQQVQSPTKAADAVAIGGCFREVANLIATGQYRGANPMNDVRTQAQLALAANAPAWEPFFGGIDALLANLQQRGVATSTENVGAILGAIGTVLASAH